METIREFEARLKLNQSRARVRAQRVYLPAGAEDKTEAGQTQLPAHQSKLSASVMLTALCLALAASLVALAGDDIARLFSDPGATQKVSALHLPARP
ncbi:MAG: hypothetical protein AAF727_11990 [Pseudomonadota bacterium]